MNYTKLGNADLEVSRICLGCMGFGNASTGQHSWTVDEPSSAEIIKKSIDLGVNFFDTAIAYQSGTSEQFLGRTLKKIAKREDVVVATKFLPRTTDDIAKNISGQQHIESMINQSLKNLEMDYVDLYIYHMWDFNTPLEEIMNGLHRIVNSGKARYIGISNCFAWQLAKINTYAEKEGLTKFISMQGHYNLIYREEEREMAPYCQDENIALTPYSALASGRLAKIPGETSKRLQEDQYAKIKYDASKIQDDIIIARVAEIAGNRNIKTLREAIHRNLQKLIGFLFNNIGNTGQLCSEKQSSLPFCQIKSFQVSIAFMRSGCNNSIPLIFQVFDCIQRIAFILGVFMHIQPL